MTGTDDPDDGAGIRDDFPTSLFSTPFSILSLSLFPLTKPVSVKAYLQFQFQFRHLS